MIGTLQDEAKALIDSVISLAYFMRGGATYEELMNMTYGERDRVSEFIKNRLEQEMKKPTPIY